MITQTLKKTTVTYRSNKAMQDYCAYDANGELIATVHQQTKDKSIHRVNWFGGIKHGKSELVECSIEGVMDLLTT